MTKTIPSLSYELKLARDLIHKLTEHVAALKEENGNLRSCLEKNKIAAPQSKPSRPPTRQVAQVTTDKHYLASTKASRNRDIQPSSQIAEELDKPKLVTVGSKRYQYKDGILVDNNPQLDTWSDKPRYLAATFSSIEKQRPKARRVWVDEYGSETEYETSATPDSSRSSSRDSSRDSSRQDTTKEFAEDPDDGPVDESDERSVQELILEKSELNRYAESHLSHAPIRSETVYDLLCRSLRIAQEVFYDGSREYLPEVHQQYDGPHEVRFGWGEMQKALFIRMNSSKRIIAGKTYWRASLEWEMEYITRIRNEVCHFTNFGNICAIKELDKAIADVQKFAAVFGDEARALQLRGLRDELIEEAERGLAELESMWLLSELPGARPWERFQLHSLCTIRHYDEDDGDNLVARVAAKVMRYQPSLREGYFPPPYIADYKDLSNSWTGQV
ncbi:hypothetical protein ABKA04_004328 [Annulohypoxylon sp. FPYF3050]